MTNDQAAGQLERANRASHMRYRQSGGRQQHHLAPHLAAITQLVNEGDV
jgi:hypothetical protein